MASIEIGDTGFAAFAVGAIGTVVLLALGMVVDKMATVFPLLVLLSLLCLGGLTKHTSSTRRLPVTPSDQAARPPLSEMSAPPSG